MSITVTIGRNVGNKPMDADQWEAFGQATRDKLAEAAQNEIWVDANYTGWWDGVSEEARVFLAPVADSAVPTVREGLAALAGEFGQDAIGLSVGEAELVHPALSHLPVQSLNREREQRPEGEARPETDPRDNGAPDWAFG